MNDGDQQAFFDLWAGAWELHGREATPGMLTLAFEVLRPFELDAIERALHVQLRSRGYGPPKPGDISELIEGSAEDLGHRAWSRVLDAVRTVGSYESVAFDDPLIHAVIAEMGGWVTLCQLTVDETPFRASEFVKRYRGYRIQRRCPPYPPVLVGLTGMDPKALEQDRQPLLLGEPQACRAAIQRGSENHTQLRIANHTAGSAALRVFERLESPSATTARPNRWR